MGSNERCSHGTHVMEDGLTGDKSLRQTAEYVECVPQRERKYSYCVEETPYVKHEENSYQGQRTR